MRDAETLILHCNPNNVFMLLPCGDFTSRKETACSRSLAREQHVSLISVSVNFDGEDKVS